MDRHLPPKKVNVGSIPTGDAIFRLTMSNLTHLTDSTFDAFLASATGRVLVAFKAVWCGPCKTLTPILEQMATDEGVTIAVVDIDESPTVAQDVGIRAVPTVVCFHNEAESGRVVGLAPKVKLMGLL